MEVHAGQAAEAAHKAVDQIVWVVASIVDSVDVALEEARDLESVAAAEESGHIR